MQLLILKLLHRLIIWLNRKTEMAGYWVTDRVCERGGHNWNPKTFQVIIDGSYYDYQCCLRCNETEKRETGTAQWLPYDA